VLKDDELVCYYTAVQIDGSGLLSRNIKLNYQKEEGKMPYIELDGEKLETDEDGFLVDWQVWKEGVATIMAKEDDLDLTSEHWEIIKFLREYFIKFQIAPMIKILVKELGKAMGPEKGNTKYLYELFPAGPAKQACRYAGLPKPTGCV
jgi:TusE/DsrC/DsvC family sulfur relay protein